MKAAIEIHKVSKTYPGKIALDRLSLSVPAGAIFALLGDNGAGKSTTIRILNGLTPPDRGYATDPRPRRLEATPPSCASASATCRSGPSSTTG